MRLDIPIKIMYGCIAGRFVQKVFTLLAGKKPLKHSAAYRYIHITDENWNKYSPALTSTREYSNFNVPCWLVRAHYARMHGKTVLVKAHFAYRRKGTVTETAVTDYIV